MNNQCSSVVYSILLCVSLVIMSQCGFKMVVITALLTLITLASLGASGDTTDCSLRGFGTNVLCSTCDELKRFELTELKQDCMDCCQTTANNEQV